MYNAYVHVGIIVLFFVQSRSHKSQRLAKKASLHKILQYYSNQKNNPKYWVYA